MCFINYPRCAALCCGEEWDPIAAVRKRADATHPVTGAPAHVARADTGAGIARALVGALHRRVHIVGSYSYFAHPRHPTIVAYWIVEIQIRKRKRYREQKGVRKRKGPLRAEATYTGHVLCEQSAPVHCEWPSGPLTHVHLSYSSQKPLPVQALGHAAQDMLDIDPMRSRIPALRRSVSIRIAILGQLFEQDGARYRGCPCRWPTDFQIDCVPQSKSRRLENGL